jgi:1,4-dihydroxy-2-naphthoate octaprenyltransferase
MHTWLMAARLRTLPAAVAPVLVGTSIAITRDVFRPGAFIAALLGAILIQVGTNLSNDYSDARRGADTEERLGPMRVTAGGLVPPRTVLLWTYLTFGAATLCGVYLVIVAGWELLVLGFASILAGVLYTGGPRPYGYEGLGEVFVFGFFGIVAVAGSAFAQLEGWPWESFALAVPVGLLVTAILVVNNIRDMDTDRRAGKRTLAVRLGRDRARLEYTALMLLGFGVLVPIAAIEIADADSWSALWWLLPWLLAPLAVKLVGVVRTHVDGPTLNAALARTAGLQLVFCVLLSAGILLS